MEKKKGKLKWIIIAVVVVIIIAAVAGGGEDNEVKEVSSKTTEASNKSSNKEEKKEKTEFSVGEIAEYDDIQVSLTKVVESKGDGQFVTPDDGNVFVLCSFEITNNSSSDITISSLMCFETYCDDVSLNEDIMGLQAPEAEGQNQLDGDIASGKKMKGVIAYQVPKDWKELEVNVSPGFWSSKDIKFVAKNK